MLMFTPLRASLWATISSARETSSLQRTAFNALRLEVNRAIVHGQCGFVEGLG
jgi:hypothetical protein